MDQGRLVSLDDNLLSQTVSSLRNVLAHDFDLPLNKQILLVSGGFQLEPGDKLSTYGAGLDKTNPIYVFTQTLPNDTSVQKPDVLQVNDGGYPRQLASLLELAPSEKVFEDRLRLIRALTPIGREAANAIEQLVSEQRQMIQGWCVALANLAEVATDTNKRLLFATSRLVQFEECISDWERKLYSFHELKKELSDLPLLPQLVVIGTSESSTNEKESLNTNNSNTSNIPKPKNLYEWVCLQSAISSIGTRYSLVSSSSSSSTPSTIKSVGLQHLGVGGGGGGGRVRTTSTGQLSSTVTTGVNQSSKVSFYTGGSQTSLNSLGMGCSNSSPPPLDNRLLIDQGSMNSVVNSNNLSTSIQQQQQQQHESSSTTPTTTTGIDYYESAFLEIIKRAIDDIHSLRYGPDVQFQSTGNGKHQQGQPQPTDTTTTTSSELTYVRAQTNRLSELITMVNTCSKSNYDEMTNSTVPHSSSSPSSSTSPASTEVNNTQLEGGISSSSSSSSNTTTTTTQGASSSVDSPPNTTTAPAAAAVGLPDNRQQTLASASSSSFSASSLHLTRDQDINYLMISVHDALDPGYFSQRLSQLDPLACEAIDLARKMIGIEQCTTKTFQQIVQQKINSLLQTKFTENTTNSQELIIAFNRLCEILGIVMQSKLLLANNLSDRQRWLQNFQSELNRLDAIIQHCLRRMCRVTTTGTLISQLGEAGSTYARCLAEIVRRTEFEDMLTQRSVYYLKEENHLRAEECRRRRIFSKHLKNNFLHTLFSPWTNPKTDCLGLINLPAPISMSQDVNDQQFCEMMSNLTVTSSSAAAAATANTTNTTTTTPTSHKLESPTTPELSVNRRYALSSLSEPRLNELAKACALHRVSYRLRSSRLNSLSSPDPQLAKVKEDEMIESSQKKSTDSVSSSSLHPSTGIHQNQSINPSQNTATSAAASAAVPLRRQHIHTPTHRIDPSRRASMPSPEPERATSTSNWSIDSTSLALTHHFYASNTAVYNNSNNHSAVKQPVKITREDLDKLMQSMPTSICNLLRTELNKSLSLFKSASFLANSSMSLVGGGGPLDQSTGLKLISTTTTTTTMMVTTSTSTTTAMATTMGTTSITGTQINAPETKSTTTSPICSIIHLTPLQLVSVACQTEFNLIEPIINVGSGRSLNSSLGLSVDDSARRTANININNNTCWEELPGSLCSWELCRFPVIRSSRDRMSISLNTLPRFEHLFVTVGTQTDLPIDFVDDNSVYNSPVLSTTNSVDAPAVLPSVDSELKGTVENDSAQPHECVSKTAPAPPHATSSCPNNNEDNEEMLDDNVVLSEIFTEAVDDDDVDDDDADLFTDSALMMTSSFHSTRTTFSNNNNGIGNNHNNQYDNDDDDNIDNLSHQHTPLMSITQSRCSDDDAADDTGCRSRSSRSSSGNLCYITDGVAAGDDGSTTTQYGSMMSDGVKTSPDDVLLLSSSSSPAGGSGVGGRRGVDGNRRHRHHHHHDHSGEVLPPPESNNDQQNQTTPSLASSSAAILDNCCIKCQLRRKHHKEYFSLLQKCLQIIKAKEENETNSLNPDVTVNAATGGGDGTTSSQCQSTAVRGGTTPETTTTTAPLQSSDTIQTPLISLNRSQLKCLLSVLESCSLMFLKKSKHSLPCLSSHPPTEETSADDKVGTDHSDPDLSTTLKEDNSEELINSTLNECTCSGVDENNEATSPSSSSSSTAADQFDFGKSLQYLLEALHLNNPVNTVSMATSTTPVHIPNETTTSMITQTELIQGVDVATSITLLNQTIEDCNSEGGKISTCISSSSSTTVPCVCDSAAAASSKMKETTSGGGGVDIHTTDDSSSSNYLTVSSYNNNNDNNSNNYNSSSSRNISSASTSAASRCTSPTSLSPVPLLQQQEQLANTSSSDNTNNNIATSGNKHKSNNALETSTCNLSGISKKSAERYTSFVHSNFAPNDIVIFVPVQGSKPNTSGLCTTGATATTTTTTATDTTSSDADSSMTTTATMASNITPTTSCILSQQNTNNPNNNNNNDLTNITKSDIWSVTSGKLSVNLLDVISPSSSLLSSMIVQSSLPLCSSIFGTSSGSGSGGGSTGTTTTTLAAANEFYSSSALLGGEVFLPTVNATITTTTNTSATTTTLGTGELPLSAPSSPPMSSTTTTATTTGGPHIQWRMLSSDGHVYFLHQDDFKALNIDENTDYCQPISSNLQETSSTQNKNQSFKEAFPAHNHFIVARYQSKQRCLSKKASNRFNLPKNFIFYRVRASPLNLPSPPPSASASASSSESPSTMTSKQNNNNDIKSNTTD
ncbi:unnamed protein product [Trichobilharzia szidati]|nr:unnamed protein product [Trichobilharzia szidati]